MEVCTILGSEGQANKLAHSHCAHLGQHAQLAFDSEAGSIDGVRAHNKFLLGSSLSRYEQALQIDSQWKFLPSGNLAWLQRHTCCTIRLSGMCLRGHRACSLGHGNTMEVFTIFGSENLGSAHYFRI